MKVRLHIFFIFGFLFFTNVLTSQLVEAKKISTLALGFEEKGKYENAIYYYKLAVYSLKDDLTSIGVGYRMGYESKIKKLTKVYAFSSSNVKYIAFLKSADSLQAEHLFMQSLFKYEKAYELVKNYSYPLDHIETIKKEHPEVIIQIAVFNATQKRLKYQKSFKKAIDKDKEGLHLESYYRLIGLQKNGHIDIRLNSLIAESEQVYKKEIAQFEELQFLAEELYLIGLYEKSLVQYNDAYSLHSECYICMQRIKDLPALIINETNTANMFANRITPEIAKEIKTLKLALEKANKYFRTEKYIKALNVYTNVKEQGLLEDNQGAFIDERIAMCIEQLKD